MKAFFLITDEEYKRFRRSEITTGQPVDARQQINSIIQANRANRPAIDVRDAVREALQEYQLPSEQGWRESGQGLMGHVPQPPLHMVSEQIPRNEGLVEERRRDNGQGLIGYVPEPRQHAVSDNVLRRVQTPDQQPSADANFDAEFEDEVPQIQYQAPRTRKRGKKIPYQDQPPMEEPDIELPEEVTNKRRPETDGETVTKKAREMLYLRSKRKPGEPVRMTSKKPREMLYRRIKRIDTEDHDSAQKKPRRMQYMRNKKEVDPKGSKKKGNLGRPVVTGGWITRN